ncbi:LysR family transcriptional regulator [Rhizobium leguminosarum]|uniref:LysR substrate-binding domain-containing protein n=1 Tax=Rhizobium leguminosarum TaxID=384 RepID=UPI001C95BDA6|nr:LysR substrate-binding domain-containing protein [Rhizobium leguminosarum]MBY5774209.1 LysR family transcriptional regulator [Rhizobium leguminosarum]
MARFLPPLAAIRAFEAVARKLSFTRAAEELGMTQAAVSYQIKLLEERLHAKLFVRLSRGVVLTEAGQRIAPNISEAFNMLRETFDDLDRAQHETLNVSTTNGFAALWLVPRLDSFRMAQPQIAVRIETTDRVVDFEQGDIDVAIRAGNGKWPGLVAVKVHDVHYAPMLSPQLAATVGGVCEPADILKLPLLDPENSLWAEWLCAHDLPTDILERQSSPSLGTQVFSAPAAMDGRGVALLTPNYFRRELEKGRLIQPLAETSKAIWGYWLTYPERSRRLRKINAFSAWLMAEAGKDAI